MSRKIILRLLSSVLLLACVEPVNALVTVEVGVYRVEIVTRPQVIPIGSADLILQITSKDGKPVKDANVRTLAKMPGMPMGEREQIAIPMSDPGLYKAPASFPMAGAYELSVSISQGKESATGAVSVQTGQNTSGSSKGLSISFVLVALVALAATGFTVYRMRRTGQRLDTSKLASRSALIGIAILAVGLTAAILVVKTQRREGSMTPLEAQGMEMNTPAPPSATPVVLATVERRTVESSVNYSGQAVGYVEIDVTPRVTGTITWMPYYAGDKVKAGQLLAKLDTSQSDPLLAERRAAATMAQQDTGIASGEAAQAELGVTEAEAAYTSAHGAVDEARASLEAMRQDLRNTEAELQSSNSGVDDANAQLQGAQADQEYWRGQIGRTAELLRAGVVSGEEYKRDHAQAKNAEAKVRQAQAYVQRTKSDVRSKQAGINRAKSMIRVAESKLVQAEAAAKAAIARIRSAQAGVSVARRKVSRANAGVVQGRAMVSAASATHGYSRLVAETDGVVTQRLISPGALVEPGQPVIRIARISPLRIQVNVSESDITRVHVGSKITVRGQNSPSKPFVAQVSSVAPSVDPTARTAVVEALIPNSNKALWPGSYVSVDIETGESRNVLAVRNRAVLQTNVSARDDGTPSFSSYVWVAEAAGSGAQYSVQQVPVVIGTVGSRYTEILSGLKDGQQVVIYGSNNLKNGDLVSAIKESQPIDTRADGTQTATVQVFATEYSPATINLKAGVPVEITFIRRAEKTCGSIVRFPDYKIERTLPMNKPVSIRLTPRKGIFRFTCGMDMFAGKMVAQ